MEEEVKRDFSFSLKKSIGIKKLCQQFYNSSIVLSRHPKHALVSLFKLNLRTFCQSFECAVPFVMFLAS